MYRPSRLPGSILFFFMTFFLFENSAFANVPIGWAAFGGAAPFFVGIWSEGISFIAVFLIEFITFWRYFHISWWKAMLMAFVVNFLSTLIGVVIAVPFAIPGFGFLFFLFILGVIFSKISAPPRFVTLAVLSVVTGAIGALLNYVFLHPPQPPIRIYVALILPLFLGFGLTLMIEGAIAKRRLHNVNPTQIWKGVLFANVLSYLFLILMLPFFPNPYDNPLIHRNKLKPMIMSGSGEAEIILVLHHFRAPTPFLLGLTDNDTPSEHPYVPRSYELNLIDDYRESHPELVQAIENDLEALKHLEAP